MLELFHKGGPVMWPLLACSFVSLMLVFERGIFWLLAARNRNPSLIDRIFRFAEQGDFEAAVNKGQASGCLVCRILASGLSQRQHGLARSLEAAAMLEIEKMKRFLSVLDTIITVAPLLGIFGTVCGIIVSFDLLGHAGIQDPKAVTGGIAQALITTAAGLFVAIAALLPYNMFIRKVEKNTRYLEQLLIRCELAVQKGLEKP